MERGREGKKEGKEEGREEGREGWHGHSYCVSLK